MVVVEEEVEMVVEMALVEMEMEMVEVQVVEVVWEQIRTCHSSDSTAHTIHHIQLEMSSQGIP